MVDTQNTGPSICIEAKTTSQETARLDIWVVIDVAVHMEIIFNQRVQGLRMVILLKTVMMMTRKII